MSLVQRYTSGGSPSLEAERSTRRAAPARSSRAMRRRRWALAGLGAGAALGDSGLVAAAAAGVASWWGLGLGKEAWGKGKEEGRSAAMAATG